jgi:hypothetical protein
MIKVSVLKKSSIAKVKKIKFARQNAAPELSPNLLLISSKRLTPFKLSVETAADDNRVHTHGNRAISLKLVWSEKRREIKCNYPTVLSDCTLENDFRLL